VVAPAGTDSGYGCRKKLDTSRSRAGGRVMGRDEDAMTDVVAAKSIEGKPSTCTLTA